MIKTSYFLIFFLGTNISSKSIAQASPERVDEKEKIQLVSPPLIEQDEEPKIIATSNHRTKFKAGFGINAGVVSAPFTGGGVSGFLALKPNLQIGFIAQKGVGEIDITSALPSLETNVFDKITTATTIATVYIRYFWGNSFFIKAGLSKRDFELDSKILNKLNPEEENNARLSVSSSAPVFSMGNYWIQQNGFYWGAEWIGLVPSVFWNYRVSLNLADQSSLNNPEILADLNKIAEAGGKAPTIQFINIATGVMF